MSEIIKIAGERETQKKKNKDRKEQGGGTEATVKELELNVFFLRLS